MGTCILSYKEIDWEFHLSRIKNMYRLQNMGHLCDLCREKGSTVYCQSDAAALCLPCDYLIHSANKLFSRHRRTLICHRCNSGPAVVKCSEENLSLCQECHWSAHDFPCTNISSAHNRLAVNCYFSGCPTAHEPHMIFSSSSSSEFSFDHDSTEGRTLTGTESIRNNGSDAQTLRSIDLDDFDQPIESLQEIFRTRDSIPENSALNEIILGGSSNLLPSLAITNSRDTEGSASVLSRNAMSADSMMSCRSDQVRFQASQTLPSLMYSDSIINDNACSYNDYDYDYDLNSMLLASNWPLHLQSTERLVPSTGRDMALVRYREKKQRRNFEKKIRYVARKARADVRTRVKGRFVKASDAFDYNNLLNYEG